MIVYGTKSTQLLKETLIERCPNCSTPNSIEMHIFQKYAHIFWIPFFPIGKTAISQCGHCKQVLKLKEMPVSLKTDYENLKLQTKTPVWTFAGAALLAIAITAGVISDRKNDEKNATLILLPKAGDIFEVKTKASQYTLYKVSAIEGDSAIVRINNFETNKISGLADLKSKGDTAYAEDEFAYSKKELKAMLDKGEIIDIDRK
ncbi:MAG: zinc-ribbon protein [Ferruginibacter sp.]|nr:zinc-ribbon protein [Ferruginibacter sp.]